MPTNIKKDVALAPYTTLGVGGKAAYFAEVGDIDTLKEIIAWSKAKNLPLSLLGSGSNVLIPDEGISGLVLRPNLFGITYIDKDVQTALVTAESGVILDTLVATLVQKGLWGLENLSGIPGTVGAVPIQNVGAYGVEAKDIVHSVTIYDIQQNAVREMSNSDCRFGYRDSIFKHTEGKDLIILAVTFITTKIPKPLLTYKDVHTYFKEQNTPTLAEIRNAILSIRSKKFPDWKKVGTAGSFFKNPIIPRSEYQRLQKEYPEIPGYDVGGDNVKISLGWILDHVCHLRGYHEGEIGLFEAQALVLVCAKGISAKEIQKFSEKIIATVFEKTGITIEREVTMFV